MENSLQVFKYRENEVRTILNDGEIWWVAADICKSLEIADTEVALRRLDDDEKGPYTVRTPGGPQKMLCINEPGLYSLIFTSRKTEAKAFKRWVTHEVLPAIRKTGSYTLPQPSLPTSHTLIYEGHALRVTVDNDTHWLVARDLCQILKVSFEAKKKVPAEQRKCYDVDTAGGRQSLLHIHEVAVPLMLSKNKSQTDFTSWLTITLPTLSTKEMILIGHETPKGVEKTLTTEQVDWRILRAILRYQAQNQKAPTEYEIHTRIWHSVPRNSLETRLPVLIIRGYVQVLASSKTTRYGIETRARK